jgi:hypothetical protein
MQSSSHQSGGGVNGASLQEMQRIQQQLQAQYNRTQQHQQQPGSGAVDFNQQHGIQSQFQLSQQRGLNSSAISFIQQQQQQQQQTQQQIPLDFQQQHNSNAALLSSINTSSSSNMQGMQNMQTSNIAPYGNWGVSAGLPQQQQQQILSQNNGNSFDPNQGSGLSLMSMAGMGSMATNASNSTMQNMQALLQQQKNAQQMSNKATLTGNLQQAQQQQLMMQANSQYGPTSANMLQNMQQPSDTALAQQLQQNNLGYSSQQMLLQQQFANLQKQMQQTGNPTATTATVLRSAAANMQGGIHQMQQIQQQGNHASGMLQARQQQLLQHQLQAQRHLQRGGMTADQGHALGQNDTSSSQQQQQHQMIAMQQLAHQQMQRQQSSGSSNNILAVDSQLSVNSNSLLPQESQPLSSLQNHQDNLMGSLNEQQLRFHHQDALRSSQQYAAMAADGQKAATMFTQGQQSRSSITQNSPHFQKIQDNIQAVQQIKAKSQKNVSITQNYSPAQQHQPDRDQSPHIACENSVGGGSVGCGDVEQVAESDSVKSDRAKPFLDGNFNGGWQSNQDLPDRRRIIFQILDVIRGMRPDKSKVSNK